ncbi:Ig-like domain-containing protein, partial [Chimaeribacter arupi]
TLSDDTGVAGDNQTNDTTPGFAITTDSDVVTVMVSIDGGAPLAAVQDAAGQWHFVTSSTLSDGEHSLIVTVTDVAGNSTSGEAFAFTVDTTVNIPVIDLNDASDSGADSADNITNVKTPTFTLSNIDADAVTVEVLINGTVYPATKTGETWSFTAPELADGEYAVQVSVTDDAGNTAISTSTAVLIDTAISAPVITLSDDTGVTGDNQTNDTTPGFAITTDSDVVTVMVSIDGGAPQAATQDAAGQWRFVTPSTLSDGEHSLIVTVTDVAGNSTSGEAFAFTVDTTVNIPTIDLNDASDSGADVADNITNVTTPTFTLSNIDADAVTVEVLINGTVYPAIKTGETWSFTAPELADGEYAVQVSVTDDAGNTATSAALTITVDTAITAPVITLSDDTGVQGDTQTNDTTPGFAITTDSDVVTVMVSIDGGAPQAAVQDAAGQWHFVTP